MYYFSFTFFSKSRKFEPVEDFGLPSAIIIDERNVRSAEYCLLSFIRSSTKIEEFRESFS